ncbi:protein AF-9 homolog [Monosporozyma unispora]
MAPPVSKRIKTLSVSRPIIYGNTAKKMGDHKPANAPVEHTHLWTIFVRDPRGEDISYYIKKVVFKLHETYPNHTRVVEAPPFELTETGWGEFDVNIKIYFIDEANEKQLNFYHRLRLHPYDNQANSDSTEINEAGETIIKSVFFDEVVFNEPHENFFQILMSKPGNLLPSNKTPKNIFSKQLEEEEIYRIKKGIDEIDKQIADLQEKIDEKDETV